MGSKSSLGRMRALQGAQVAGAACGAGFLILHIWWASSTYRAQWRRSQQPQITAESFKGTWDGSYDWEHKPRDQCKEEWNFLIFPKDKPNEFKKIGKKEEERAIDSWQNFLDHLPRYQSYRMSASGPNRGIVMAGGAFNYKQVLMSVKMLRAFGCQLPVELWHFPGELNTTHYQHLQSLDVRLKNVADIDGPRTVQLVNRDKHQNPNIKATALINSEFQEMLWMDADNLPAQDPTYLFETNEFKYTGAMFFPDYWKTHTQNPIFNIMQVPCLDEFEFETGQMLVNKAKSWDALNLAWLMNNRSELYYQMLHYDKDTFRFAWKATRTQYHFVEHHLSAAGFSFEVNGEKKFCGHTMLQHDPKASVVFVHANLIKYNQFGVKHSDFSRERPWSWVQKFSFWPNTTNARPVWIRERGMLCIALTTEEPELTWMQWAGLHKKPQKQVGGPEVETLDFNTYVPGFYSKFYEVGGPAVIGWEDFRGKAET